MSSAFLSPIGERPIDPEEADEELDADQVHKEWKEYYERQKKEMEREHKVVVRHLEKSREEIAKVRDRLTSEAVTWWQMHSGKQLIQKDLMNRHTI
jgi:hypothetical protein